MPDVDDKITTDPLAPDTAQEPGTGEDNSAPTSPGTPPEVATVTVDAADRRTYIGTKTIHAWPLTRADYTKYRGWELPADENGDDAGYLVEYTDGGKSNHPAHEGYISWSPADVFAAAYKPANDFRERLVLEHDELEERLEKLTAFQGTLAHDQLPLPDRELLAAQHMYMTKYAEVLSRRMQRALAK